MNWYFLYFQLKELEPLKVTFYFQLKDWYSHLKELKHWQLTLRFLVKESLPPHNIPLPTTAPAPLLGFKGVWGFAFNNDFLKRQTAEPHIDIPAVI